MHMPTSWCARWAKINSGESILCGYCGVWVGLARILVNPVPPIISEIVYVRLCPMPFYNLGLMSINE